MRILLAAIFCILAFGCENPKEVKVQEETPSKEVEVLSVKEVSDSIKSYLKAFCTEGDSIAMRECLYPGVICAFYGSRGNAPAWFNPYGFDEQLDSFLSYEFPHSILALEPAFNKDFLQGSVDSLKKRATAKEQLSSAVAAKLDIQITDWLIWLIDHQERGIIPNPYIADSRWHIADTISLDLPTAIAFFQESPNIKMLLQDLPGNTPGVFGLENAFSFWAAKQNDSLQPEKILFAEGEKLEVDSSGDQVSALIELLHYQGYALDTAVSKTHFDSSLHYLVKDFQFDRGLYPDGIVGNGTANWLNMSPEDYINLLRVNLERNRWLPADLGDYYVMVNIPEFHLRLYQNDSAIFDSRTVVGKKSRQTPVLSALMTYLEINPTWTIPPTILAQDVLPQLGENTDYLKNKNIGVYTHDGKKIHPDSVNWSAYSSKSLPYKLRQAPGWNNSLGLIKFMFPNKYYIYIHDTPSKYLFNHGSRAYSSGCVRLADPRDFATLLLKNDTAWTYDKIVANLGGSNQKVPLTETPMVYMLYLTAFNTGSGMRYFPDIYNRDESILNLLNSSLNYEQALELKKKNESEIYSEASANKLLSETAAFPESN